MCDQVVSVLIIGAGPAGYTAAIYAARAGLNPVLYQGQQPGGQLMITTVVENYPGYPDGIDGPAMMANFEKQTQKFGTEIKTETITSVDFSIYPYQLTIDNQHIISTKTVIIASGATAKWLGIASEKRLHGRGVSACATCDGFFFRGKDVAVVGGGDSAAEEAGYLANICNKVYLLIRSHQMRASQIMQKRIMEKKNIEIWWNTGVTDILGDNEVIGVEVVNNLTQEIKKISLQGLFVAIGHQPNTQLFESYLDLNQQGYIRVIPGTTQTNIPGIFAAGDVQDPIYKQAVTAAGTGCMAALEAERFLSIGYAI